MRRASVRAVLAWGCALLFMASTPDPGRGTCVGLSVDPADVVAAIFPGEVFDCDMNGDGRVNAADLTRAVALLAATPRATSTGTATPNQTGAGSPRPTRTPTPTQSASATVTRTRSPCPTGGATLAISVDNRSGISPVRLLLNGEELEKECSGPLARTYSVSILCTGANGSPCIELTALAPGLWRHTVTVVEPDRGQIQHRRSLLVAESAPNQLTFTAFASVARVSTAANDGDGSLRLILRDAGTLPAPLLIRFDPAAFPPGVPTAIPLLFALPTLSADDVTIDGTDATGTTGLRIIDARGLPIGALAISGARNHVIGLTLRNAGGSNHDVLGIAGPDADANVIENCLIENAATGDGIGIDLGAGKDFGLTSTVVRNSEIRGASDKGIKVTTGAYARIEGCHVHDNVNGGVQATLGGHVEARYNLIENNHGGTAQNGLAANPPTEGTATSPTELATRGNISRGNGAAGTSVRGWSVADLRDDYLAENASTGLRVSSLANLNPPTRVEGTSAVCNGIDGAVIETATGVDLGGGELSSPGNNAFTQNNLPGGGENLRNAGGGALNAINAQWEHCGTGTSCNDNRIAALDISDHGTTTLFVPTQAHRAQNPVVTHVIPEKGMAGEFVRIFGSGFNVIDGHFSEDRCSEVSARNRCVPLRGNCIRIGGVPAPVEAVTPTMLVARWPFTCIAPVSLTVTVDHGATGAESEAVSVCNNAP